MYWIYIFSRTPASLISTTTCLSRSVWESGPPVNTARRRWFSLNKSCLSHSHLFFSPMFKVPVHNGEMIWIFNGFYVLYTCIYLLCVPNNLKRISLRYFFVKFNQELEIFFTLNSNILSLQSFCPMCFKSCLCWLTITLRVKWPTHTWLCFPTWWHRLCGRGQEISPHWSVSYRPT